MGSGIPSQDDQQVWGSVVTPKRGVGRSPGRKRILAYFESHRTRVAVDMDIHGYIHGYIHVWISDFGNIHGYLWIFFM